MRADSRQLTACVWTCSCNSPRLRCLALQTPVTSSLSHSLQFCRRLPLVAARLHSELARSLSATKSLMEKHRPRVRLLLLAAAGLGLMAAVQQCAGQFGGMPGMEPPPKAAAVKSDVPFIRCQACEAVVKQAARKVKAMREALKPGQKLDEGDVIEFLERMCDAARPEGKWISNYDIVEAGQELKLVDVGQPSTCNSECATLARACSQLTESLDLSDLSEALYNGASRSALNQLACYESSGACRSKPPPVPKDRKPGPAHVPLSADDAARDDMMARMKAAGLGGQMYNTEHLMQQVKGLQEDADDGAFGSVPLSGSDAGGDGSGAKAGAAGAAAEAVSKAGAAVKERLAKAGGLLKKLSSRMGRSAAAKSGDGEF